MLELDASATEARLATTAPSTTVSVTRVHEAAAEAGQQASP